MVLEEYEKKDITKSPETKVVPKEIKTKAVPKKVKAGPKITKDGGVWSFTGEDGNTYSYRTKERAELRLEQFIEQAKRET